MRMWCERAAHAMPRRGVAHLLPRLPACCTGWQDRGAAGAGSAEARFRCTAHQSHRAAPCALPPALAGCRSHVRHRGLGPAARPARRAASAGVRSTVWRHVLWQVAERLRGRARGTCVVADPGAVAPHAFGRPGARAEREWMGSVWAAQLRDCHADGRHAGGCSRRAHPCDSLTLAARAGEPPRIVAPIPGAAAAPEGESQLGALSPQAPFLRGSSSGDFVFTDEEARGGAQASEAGGEPGDGGGSESSSVAGSDGSSGAGCGADADGGDGGVGVAETALAAVATEAAAPATATTPPVELSRRRGGSLPRSQQRSPASAVLTTEQAAEFAQLSAGNRVEEAVHLARAALRCGGGEWSGLDPVRSRRLRPGLAPPCAPLTHARSWAALSGAWRWPLARLMRRCWR